MHPDMLSELNERLRVLSDAIAPATREIAEAISEAARKDAAHIERKFHRDNEGGE